MGSKECTSKGGDHFEGGDRSYQFTALSFRIATAPLEFTMAAKEVKLMALAEGIRIHQYIDDESKNTMSREYPQVDSSCSKSGLDDKFRKIRFNSNSRNRIFGLQIRPQGRASLSNSKEIDRLLGKTVSMLEASHTSPWKLMSLIGSMASMEKTIPMGRLHMRPLQWYLKTHWRYIPSLWISQYLCPKFSGIFCSGGPIFQT